MVDQSFHRKPGEEPFGDSDSPNEIDYTWFNRRFENLLERFSVLENALTAIEQSVATAEALPTPSVPRKFYSVAEFAALVGRGEYTVREWCRLARINAEKCDSGRGDTKNWKIPAEELQRYRDHGLLPASYLR